MKFLQTLSWAETKPLADTTESAERPDFAGVLLSESVLSGGRFALGMGVKQTLGSEVFEYMESIGISFGVSYRLRCALGERHWMNAPHWLTGNS